MFNMKNIPLFFLEVSLVILPAVVYGIPILPTVPQGLVPEKLDVGDLNLLPEKLDVVVPTVPTSKINIPIEPVDVITSIPQVDKVQIPLTEKLLQEEEKPLVVPAELNPQVQQLPLVDNVNLLPEKPNEEVPLAVVATFLHIDNVQVIIPAKLLEKIFSQKPLTLLSVQSEPQGGVVGLPEKLEGIVTEQLSLVTVDSLPQVGEVEKLGEPLSPLAVIASIPQIGNIQLVFSGELLKNILSKKLIPSVSVDNTLLTLEEIVPEKPLLLVPNKVDNVLPVVPVESEPQISDVTVLPGLLEEIVTEKPLLLVPGESTLQGTGELLDKLPSKELLSLDPVKSKLSLGNVVVLPEVVDQKPLPSVPVELASGVVNQISNLLPAVPTFIPALDLSAHEKLPINE